MQIPGVLELGGSLDLAPEAQSYLRQRQVGTADQLQSHEPLHRLLFRQVHDPHSAAAEDLDQAVVPQALGSGLAERLLDTNRGSFTIQSEPLELRESSAQGIC